MAPRTEHVAIVGLNNRLYLIGGQDNGGAMASIDEFDGATVSRVANLPSPTWEHAAALLNDGTIYTSGGFDGANVLAVASTFDPATRIVTLRPPLASPRGAHSLTALHDGRVLLAGGYLPDNPWPSRADGEIRNPASGASVAVALMDARQRQVAALLPVGRPHGHRGGG